MRVLPPYSAVGTTQDTVFGRTYTCALGSSLDVGDADGRALESNGWIVTATYGAMTTVQRLAISNPKFRDTCLDTTLGYIVIFDGAAWRNPVTAASV